jgi:hypothetical protein
MGIPEDYDPHHDCKRRLEETEHMLTEAEKREKRFHDALLKLSNELQGVLHLCEPDIQEHVGVTNMQCLLLRQEEARALLGKT